MNKSGPAIIDSVLRAMGRRHDTQVLRRKKCYLREWNVYFTIELVKYPDEIVHYVVYGRANAELDVLNPGVMGMVIHPGRRETFKELRRKIMRDIYPSIAKIEGRIRGTNK